MGEVIVQNYNAVLTLSHLYQSSDAILVVQNDHIQRICTQLLNIDHVSFNNINSVIAQQLCSVMQPAYKGLAVRDRLIRSHLGLLIDILISISWGCMAGVL